MASSQGTGLSEYWRSLLYAPDAAANLDGHMRLDRASRGRPQDPNDASTVRTALGAEDQDVAVTAARPSAGADYGIARSALPIGRVFSLASRLLIVRPLA